MQKSTIIRLKKNQNINPKKYKKEQNDINNSNNNFRKILMYQKNLDKIIASLSQSTLATNKKNFNINSMAIPMDSRYYFSTNKITKKLPLSKNLFELFIFIFKLLFLFVIIFVFVFFESFALFI